MSVIDSDFKVEVNFDSVECEVIVCKDNISRKAITPTVYLMRCISQLKLEIISLQMPPEILEES